MAEASARQKGGWSARLGGHGIARAEPLTWVLRERVWGTALQKGRVESKTGRRAPSRRQPPRPQETRCAVLGGGAGSGTE